jgi:transcriptional regulator with XRE-family HTH domain
MLFPVAPRFARTIKRARHASKLSQNALARRAKVTQAYISELEAGSREPSLRVLRRLADALGVSPGVLMD